jgi:hypothetical protein
MTPLDGRSARRRNLYLTKQTKRHAPGGIQSHILSRRTVANQRHRPRGHWDRHWEHIRHQNLNTTSKQISLSVVSLRNFIKTWIHPDSLAWELRSNFRLDRRRSTKTVAKRLQRMNKHQTLTLTACFMKAAFPPDHWRLQSSCANYKLLSDRKLAVTSETEMTWDDLVSCKLKDIHRLYYGMSLGHRLCSRWWRRFLLSLAAFWQADWFFIPLSSIVTQSIANAEYTN